MGRQESIIKFKGRMGGLSFTKTKNGYMVRKASGIDGKRVLKDPNYERTRSNMKEFSVCGVATSKILRGVHHQTSEVKDGGCFNRLMSALSKIKNLDITQSRGSRTVMGGMENKSSIDYLKNFPLNSFSILKLKLQANMEIDTVSGVIVLKKFNPSRQLLRPDSSTHIGVQSTWLQLDLNGTYEVSSTDGEVLLPIENRTFDFEIPMSKQLLGSGLNLLFLRMAYYTEDTDNGFVQFKDLKWNPWSIVELWMTRV